MTDTTDPQTADLPDRLEAVLTERFTELGNPYSRMRIAFQGADGWPASKEVGPHDVAEVLRELLAAAPTVPADRAGLRERIAAAIWERQNPGRRWADCEYRWRADAEEDADVVLSVLPSAADRAAVLREAADLAESLRQFEPATGARKSAQVSENVGILRVAEELRRMADEEQQQCPGVETVPNRCTCDCEGCKHHCGAHQGDEEQQAETQAPDTDPVYDPRAWETYRRDAGCGCTAPAPVHCKIPHGTGVWLCTCHRLAGPPLRDGDPRGTFLTSEEEAIRRHFQEPNRCLSTDGIFRCSRPIGHLGDHRTGRTFWGRRAEDTTPPAVVAEPGKENGHG